MTILMLSWENFGTNDMRDAFEELGHRVILLPTGQEELLGEATGRRTSSAVGRNTERETIGRGAAGKSNAGPDTCADSHGNSCTCEDGIAGKILRAVDRENADIVFGFNYFPEVAKVCKELELPYYAWVYDCPCIQLFSYTIIFPTNHIFVFDSDTYYRFANQGITTISFLPMAANPKRLAKLWGEGVPSGTHGKATSFHGGIDGNNISVAREFTSDISFVGSLYTEEHQFYNRMLEKGISPHSEGYLRGLIAAQKNLYGCNIVESLLTEDLLSDLHRALPLEPDSDSAATVAYLFTEFVINRQITAEERTEYLKRIGSFLWDGRATKEAKVGKTGASIFHEGDTTRSDKETSGGMRCSLYTRDKSIALPGWTNHGPVDFYEGAPRIFHGSGINLNITLRSIVNGIPLRCFEIMGSAGFLLTNYQGDFDLFFENGRDYVAYESTEDLTEKVSYYLEHDAERREIARNGFERICEAHTYLHRAEELLRN